MSPKTLDTMHNLAVDSKFGIRKVIPSRNLGISQKRGCMFGSTKCCLVIQEKKFRKNTLYNSAPSPSANFKSTLRTLRILNVRNSYLQNSQGQKLTLRMSSDLKKISSCFVCDVQKPEKLIDLPSDSLDIHVYVFLYEVSTLWSTHMLTRMK